MRSCWEIGKEIKNNWIELNPIEWSRRMLGGQRAIEQSLQELVCNRDLREKFSKQTQGIVNKNI
jgi:hypothetical protein